MRPIPISQARMPSRLHPLLVCCRPAALASCDPFTTTRPLCPSSIQSCRGPFASPLPFPLCPAYPSLSAISSIGTGIVTGIKAVSLPSSIVTGIVTGIKALPLPSSIVLVVVLRLLQCDVGVLVGTVRREVRGHLRGGHLLKIHK